ncbi:hypothetical protein HOY80DRAFT_1104928 [Tuber brumale]|nr:hypothetical protein HOY80DRAFT_1104928 [Tuber brumale]
MPLLNLLYLFTLTPLLLLLLHSPTTTHHHPSPPPPTRTPPLRVPERATPPPNAHLFLSITRSSLPPSPATPPNSFLSAPCHILEYYMTWLAGFLLIMPNTRYILRKEWVTVLFIYNTLYGGHGLCLFLDWGRCVRRAVGLSRELGFCM